MFESSNDTFTKKKYIMRVCNRLLIKLKMAGISPTEAAVFFGSQVEPMLVCRPNFGPGSNKSKAQELKRDVWLMRGFYPGSSQMFKISIAENDAFTDYQYYVKVSEPAVRIPTKKSNRGLDFTPRYESTLDSEQIGAELNKRAENELLGQEHVITTLISDKVCFTPKCISPKGMPMYRLNLKKE